MNCYVYIIYNLENDKFYIGQTYSIKKRLAEHKAGLGGYTHKFGNSWHLVYLEKLPSRQQAMAKEKYLKSLKSKTYLKKYITHHYSVG